MFIIPITFFYARINVNNTKIENLTIYIIKNS